MNFVEVVQHVPVNITFDCPGEALRWILPGYVGQIFEHVTSGSKVRDVQYDYEYLSLALRTGA